jgi:two-component system chemotaxis response regulator CheB
MDPAIDVVASARDPFEARDAIIKYKPDVMTLDIELPRMSGIEFLRKLMPQYPMPVVVISSLSDKVFDALEAGAVDFVAKPKITQKSQLEYFIQNDLTTKIKIASIAKIGKIKQTTAGLQERLLSSPKSDIVVAIGASTGGTEATAQILQALDIDIPGIVIVQHMPPGFTKMYADRLNDQCRITVKEAKSGDIIVPGQALIAPGGEEHMKVIKSGSKYQVVCQKAPKVNGHCPSVDVLFDSVAKVIGNKAVGVILTGMGADGSKGLLAMRNNGARTIGQDEASCVVYGMPKVAYNIGAVQYQEKLTNIASKIYTLVNQIQEERMG